MQLYKAEVPGPVLEKMTPRIAETARSLWKIYLLLSVSQVMLLMFFGMDLFDAVCHSFTTMATGGFSTKNKSLESFNNSGIEIICIIFMFAAGINFSLHYRLFNGKLTSFFKDREFQTYSLILLIATVFIALCLTANGKPVFESIKNAAFQTVSIMTTTGYSNTNFDQWPAFNKIILFLLMFIGGSAGSTGGGIKCVRILLLLKMAYREFITMIHPHAVTSVKIAGKTVSQNILRSISVFVVCYLLLFIFGSLFMSLCGLDFMTSISSTAASLGNIGPGMAGVGPYENYQFMPDFGKWTLILLMLLGRLEIFTILIIFIPEFWKK
jgi:trk system potassium uptake protein TrkH